MKISPTMLSAVKYARKYNNILTLHGTGFWYDDEAMKKKRDLVFFKTATITSMLKRELVTVTKWKKTRGTTIVPEVVTLTQKALDL